jgi:hypothetical protein
VSLEKEKGLLLLELCVGEEEDVCFFSPHPKFRLEETLFQTLVASFASFPPSFFIEIPIAFVSLFCFFFFLAST